jgi:hypothetical protein
MVMDNLRYNSITTEAVNRLKAEGFNPYGAGNSHPKGGWTYETCMLVLNYISETLHKELLEYVSDNINFTDEWKKALKDTCSSYIIVDEILLGKGDDT